MKTIVLLTLAAASGLTALPGISQTSVDYASPLADYQFFTDEKLTSWRAANDQVGQIGGWRAYAKEAQEPDNRPGTTPAAPANAPTSVPGTGGTQTIDPHAGHHQ